MNTRPTCRGQKDDGSPCRYYALDNGYCHVHQALAEETRATDSPAKWTRGRLEAAIAANGGPEGLDLAGADLSGLDLSGMDLHRVRFSRAGEDGGRIVANLQGANLALANLQEADLALANLQAADLWWADLQDASLQGASLRGANLQGANLQGADLREANLQGALLWFANLQEAGVSANLQGADLREANLQGALLWFADLRGATLLKANLKRALLLDANLQEADLWEANLQGADLREADLQGADLRRADLQGADLQGANLQGANLQGASLQGANSVQLDLLDVAEGALRGVPFFRARLDRTLMKREQLGAAIGDELYADYCAARDAYLALKQNFESLGDYEAASWAYVKERKMERASSAPWRARRFYGQEELGDVPKDPEGRAIEKRLRCYHPRVLWFYTRHTVKWAKDGLIELVCNYGEGPWQTLASIAVVFLGFAIFYSRGGLMNWVVDGPQGTTLLRTWDLGAGLLLSLCAMTTIDVPWLQPSEPWVAAVMGFEALLAIGLTGLLGFVLGNRIRRS